MTLPVTDATPLILSLPLGTWLYTVDGAAATKVRSGGAAVYSPFGQVGWRAVVISTGGVRQLALVEWPGTLPPARPYCPPAAVPPAPVSVTAERVPYVSATRARYGWDTRPVQITPELAGELRWPVTMPGLESVEGKTFPVVVTLPGGPFAPPQWRNVEILGGWLVASGAFVLMADYRSLPAYGGGWPMSVQDVCAAVALARERGAIFNGAPSKVVLAAHSFGGLYGLLAATWPEIPGVGPEGRPDAYVSIDAISDRSHVIPETYASLGLPAEPYERLGGRKVPVTVIDAGGWDLGSWSTLMATQRFADAAATAGHPTRYIIVEGADHTSVLSDETVLPAVMGAMA